MDPPRGFHDFYPNEERERQALFHILRTISEEHGYSPWSGPTVENLALLASTGADHMYEIRPASSFGEGELGDGEGSKEGSQDDRQHHHQRELVLRPEHTTSLVRMLRKRQNGAGEMRLSMPILWYTIGPCWRVERPGKGRWKEHTQWNCDVIGDSTLNGEVTLFSTLFAVLDFLQIPPFTIEIRVSSTSLLRAVLRVLGIAEQRVQNRVLKVLDRYHKVGGKEVEKTLGPIVGSKSASDILRLLVHVHHPQQLLETCASCTDGVEEVGRELRSFQLLYSTLQRMPKFGSRILFDPSIVRGLHYYTGLVFEGFETPGTGESGEMERRGCALFGGGRYDNSFETQKSPKAIPAIGLGMGDVRMLSFLRAQNLQKVSTRLPLDVCVTVEDEEQMALCMLLAARLRTQGKRCVTRCASFKKVAKRMAKQGVGMLVVPLTPTIGTVWTLRQGNYVQRELMCEFVEG